MALTSDPRQEAALTVEPPACASAARFIVSSSKTINEIEHARFMVGVTSFFAVPSIRKVQKDCESRK
jgi:hypothetical protein